MYELNEREIYLSKEIVDAAFKVHKALGPSVLEKVYEICFCHELAKKNIAYERQIKLPVYYDGLFFSESLQCDVVVDKQIIVELKAHEVVNSVWPAQVISHLKLSSHHVGFLINFHVEKIKDGIRRYCVE
jgi:GxxExxY protein